MIYGLYLSATGVMTNSYRQDVIANNLANSETVGFKRNLATFQQRATAAQEKGQPNMSNAMLDHIGGGLFLAPTQIDTTQGELESTGQNLDAAIVGKGVFAVDDHGKTLLTRDGRFMLDRNGELIMANGTGQKVLDPEGKPIKLPDTMASKVQLGKDGQITYLGKPLARLGVFDVPDPSQLVKEGGNLMTYPNLPKALTPSDAEIRSGFLERANVDPANELTLLMETQRTLEANANMIRYQDQSLSRLVNEVGKIG